MKKVRFSRSWLAIPYALFLAVFVIVPLFFVLYYAFRDDVTGQLTFGNFKTFFTTPVNLKVAGRSLMIAALSTILCSFKIAFRHPKTHRKLEFEIDKPFGLS